MSILSELNIADQTAMMDFRDRISRPERECRYIFFYGENNGIRYEPIIGPWTYNSTPSIDNKGLNLILNIAIKHVWGISNESFDCDKCCMLIEQKTQDGNESESYVKVLKKHLISNDNNSFYFSS